MTHDDSTACADDSHYQDHHEDENAACTSGHRFTVSSATSWPKKSPAAAATAVAQTDYIPMDYDAELEACSDVVFSESSYYCTVPSSTAAATDSESEHGYVPYDYDEALYGECDDTATTPQALEPYSETWLETQQSRWVLHAEGLHYAWCQRMAGESCYSSSEQSAYALKALVREAYRRDIAQLRAMPAACFTPGGAVEDRRMEANRSASCTSWTSLAAYIEAQQIRARYLGGERDRDACDDDAARKAAYIVSAQEQWRLLGEYVSRELAEDAMRLRSLSNAVQQLCLFRAESVAPDLEVIFSRHTTPRPNTPYSALFGVARELDLSLVESQKRERRQRAEAVLATLASHKTLFMPPVLRASEEEAPVAVPVTAQVEPSCAGVVGGSVVLSSASSPFSGPSMHSPLFSLILDVSELETAQQQQWQLQEPLLLLAGDADDDGPSSLTSPSADMTASPWEVSLPWSAPSMENDFNSVDNEAAPGSIPLRHSALSWTDLAETTSQSQNDCRDNSNNNNNAGTVTPSHRMVLPRSRSRANCSVTENAYVLPSALLCGKGVGLSNVIMSPSMRAACGAFGVDSSPSRFSSFTEGQSSCGEGSDLSEAHQLSGAWTLPEAAVTPSPELCWLSAATPTASQDDNVLPPAPIGQPQPTSALSAEMLQHHEQHSTSGRARTHQEIESICRGWLFDTTTCHFRSGSSDSTNTERGADCLTFYAEMMDDEDRRVDADEVPLTL